MTMRIALASSVVIAILVFAPSHAGGQSVHREYDVRDLIINIPDFTDTPHLNAPSTQLRLPAEDDPKKAELPGREQLIAELTSWLRESARHDEPAIQIVENAGRLGIDATQPQHERITRLIEERGAERKVQASIEVRYLFLTPEAEDAVDGKFHDLLSMSRGPGSGNRPGIELTKEQVDELQKATQAHANVTQMTAPRVTLFNGQRAYVLIATDRAYVADYTKRIDPNGGNVSWEPVNKNIRTGVMLDVRCRVNVGTRTVACDLNTTVDRLLDLPSERFAPAGDAAGLTIQKPDLDHVEMHQLAAVRDGTTSLYHLPRRSSENRLYVLVKPTIVQAP